MQEGCLVPAFHHVESKLKHDAIDENGLTKKYLENIFNKI